MTEGKFNAKGKEFSLAVLAVLLLNVSTGYRYVTIYGSSDVNKAVYALFGATILAGAICLMMLLLFSAKPDVGAFAIIVFGGVLALVLNEYLSMGSRLEYLRTIATIAGTAAVAVVADQVKGRPERTT
jgi:hypothetical protein